MREHHFSLSSVTLTKESIASFDALLLATDHDKFDYELIKASAQLLIDCRGKFLEPAPNIIKA